MSSRPILAPGSAAPVLAAAHEKTPSPGSRAGVEWQPSRGRGALSRSDGGTTQPTASSPAAGGWRPASQRCRARSRPQSRTRWRCRPRHWHNRPGRAHQDPGRAGARIARKADSLHTRLTAEAAADKLALAVVVDHCRQGVLLPPVSCRRRKQSSFQRRCQAAETPQRTSTQRNTTLGAQLYCQAMISTAATSSSNSMLTVAHPHRKAGLPRGCGHSVFTLPVGICRRVDLRSSQS